MSKDKGNETTTALATIDTANYAVMAADMELAELIQANLGGEKMTERDLEQVRIPAAGGVAWDVAGEPVASLEGIVIHVAPRRSYWRESDPSSNPPDCFSTDMVRGQGDPGGECETCPMAQWGSADKGRGQACKESRILFMVRNESLLPLAVKLPPSSIDIWKKYVVKLAGLGLPMFCAITRLDLEQDKSESGIKYSIIKPSCVGKLDKAQMEKIRSYSKELQKAFS